jgi:hypothetical protein
MLPAKRSFLASILIDFDNGRLRAADHAEHRRYFDFPGSFAFGCHGRSQIVSARNLDAPDSRPANSIPKHSNPILMLLRTAKPTAERLGERAKLVAMRNSG